MHPSPRYLVRALVVGVLMSSVAAQAETMTLVDCLRQALEHNPGLRATDDDVAAAQAERDSVRGHLLPTVKLKGNLLGWDSAFDARVDVTPLSALLKDFEPFLSDESKQVLADLKQNGLPFRVHDQLTYQAAVVVAQPLTQLYQIIAGYRAQDRLADAAKMDRLGARHRLELDVARAYFGLIAALKLRETARAGLAQVEAMEKQVGAYLKAGVVERNALLKVQVQKLDIQRKLLQTESAIALARAMLNAAMGRPLSTSLEPEAGRAALARVDETLAEEQARALQARPELRSARSRRAAAAQARHAAVGEMLPPLTAVFTYENTHGFATLIKTNQFFGGLLLDWNLWEWGVGYYKVRAAQARERAAANAVRAAEDQIRLDVEARRLAVDEAAQSLELARRQSEQAVENLRVERLRFAAQETTVTDLLAAQTGALQAENEATVAAVKLDEALLTLRAATGGDLLEMLTAER